MNKRKLMLVAITLCMAAILLAGGTLAYLTDTDQQTNTFTTGHVALELDEGKITTSTDGKWESTDQNDRTSDPQTYKVFPGDVVVKDPTIHIGENSEDAWVAAKIVVKGNLYPLIGSVSNTIDITKLVSGGLVIKGSTQTTWHNLTMYETDKCYIYQVVDTIDAVDDPSTEANEDTGAGQWTLYVYMKARQEKNADILLFDTLTIPSTWNNEELKLFNESTIDITAYAVQEDGFVDAYVAMATAFNVDGAVVFPAN